MTMNAGPGNTISAMPNARTVTPISVTATFRANRRDRVVTEVVPPELASWSVTVVVRQLGLDEWAR